MATKHRIDPPGKAGAESPCFSSPQWAFGLLKHWESKRNDFSHGELAKRDSVPQLYLPPNAPLSSRDQEKSQAKAAAEPPDGSLPPVAGLEGASADV